MVAFMLRVLYLSSDDLSHFKTFLSKMFPSMLVIIFKKVNLSLEWLEQWRRKWVDVKISWPQLLIELSESRKSCLNLRFRRWLRPSYSLVKNLTPLGLWRLETLISEGRVNFKSFFLELFRFAELHIFWSSFFHSITEGKKEF